MSLVRLGNKKLW